jgi:hypothetical protein
LRIFKEFFWWRADVASPHTPQTASHAFEKLLFGTDEDPVHLADNMQRYKKMLDACDVPADVQVKVMGATAARLLKLK